MGLFGAGNAAYWRSRARDMPAFGGRPIWMSLWFKNSGAAWQGPACFQGLSASAWVGVYQNAGVNFLGDLNDSAQGAAPSLGSWVGSNWVNLTALFVTPSLRRLYQSGVLLGTDTTTVNPPQSLSYFTVGQVPGAYLGLGSAVAEAAFGTGLLSAAQIAALAAGANVQRVAPSQLLAYYPLRGSLEDLSQARAGLQFSSTSTPRPVWSDHPPVDLPPRRRLFHGAGVVVPPPTVRPRIRMVA
jgi:hypothetical protein